MIRHLLLIICTCVALHALDQQVVWDAEDRMRVAKPEQRPQLIGEISSDGPLSAAVLPRWLDDPSPTIRSAVLVALARHPAAHEQVAWRLGALLGDADRRVLVAAIGYVAASKDVASGERLTFLLGNPDAEVDMLARRALVVICGADLGSDPQPYRAKLEQLDQRFAEVAAQLRKAVLARDQIQLQDAIVRLRPHRNRPLAIWELLAPALADPLLSPIVKAMVIPQPVGPAMEIRALGHASQIWDESEEAAAPVTAAAGPKPVAASRRPPEEDGFPWVPVIAVIAVGGWLYATFLRKPKAAPAPAPKPAQPSTSVILGLPSEPKPIQPFGASAPPSPVAPPPAVVAVAPPPPITPRTPGQASRTNRGASRVSLGQTTKRYRKK